MSDQEALHRLQLATRLHGSATIVLEMLLTPPDGVVSTKDLHIMCSVAERVERAADKFGPDTALFTDLVFALMQCTETVREYVDREILSGRVKPAALRVARQEWQLQRDPGETDEDFERRRQLLTLPDWTPEDDRLAVHSQIADAIDEMPIEKLQRVLSAVREIAK